MLKFSLGNLENLKNFPDKSENFSGQIFESLFWKYESVAIRQILHALQIEIDAQIQFGEIWKIGIYAPGHGWLSDQQTAENFLNMKKK